MRLHNHNAKGQTALEFLILTGFMLFVFTGFFMVIKERDIISAQKTQYTELATIADTIDQEVSSAHRVYDGYSRTFYLPPTVNGQPYNITVPVSTNASEAILQSTDFQYVLFLSAPVNLVDSSSRLPTTIWSPGQNNITKFNGQINITVQRCTPVCNPYSTHAGCNAPAYKSENNCGTCNGMGMYCSNGICTQDAGSSWSCKTQ